MRSFKNTSTLDVEVATPVKEKAVVLVGKKCCFGMMFRLFLMNLHG